MSTKLTPYQAWLRSSLRQDYIAREMGMDPTQLNHLLRGRRPWNAAARAASSLSLAPEPIALPTKFPAIGAAIAAAIGIY